MDKGLGLVALNLLLVTISLAWNDLEKTASRQGNLLASILFRVCRLHGQTALLAWNIAGPDFN